MNKEVRNILCKNCLFKVRSLEAKYLKRWRLKIKQGKQTSGKIVVKKLNN